MHAPTTEKVSHKKTIPFHPAVGTNNLGEKAFLFLLLLLPFAFAKLYGSAQFVESSILNYKNFSTAISDNTLIQSSIFGYGIKAVISNSPILAIFLFEFFHRGLRSGHQGALSSIASLKRSEGHKYADVWYFFLYHIFTKVGIIATFLTLGLHPIFQGLSAKLSLIYNKFNFISSNLLLATLAVVALVVIDDLLIYINHRFSHAVPRIWRLHEFHHSATEMTILSGYRTFTLDVLASFIVILPFKALTGVMLLQLYDSGMIIPLIVYIVYQTMSTIYAQFAHSSVKLIYPKFISAIFLSPSLHWFHHSTNPSHFDSNFGPCLAFWDKLFGTYIGEERLHEIRAFGVPGTDYNKYSPLFSTTILPIRKFILNK